MTRRFTPFEVVTLPEGLPEHGFPPGIRGTVLDVYEEPELAYEIEIADGHGRTLFLGAVEAVYVEADEPTAQ